MDHILTPAQSHGQHPHKITIIINHGHVSAMVKHQFIIQTTAHGQLVHYQQ
jgi:hypothetical protein